MKNHLLTKALLTFLFIILISILCSNSNVYATSIDAIDDVENSDAITLDEVLNAKEKIMMH